MLYYHLKEFLPAVKDFTRALASRPRAAKAFITRALCYAYLQQNKQALDDAMQVVEIEPETASSYLIRGQVYWYRREYDQALADFNQVITLNPTNSDAYVYRGTIYAYSGHLTLAFDDYTHALQLDPHSSTASYYRGCCFLRTQKLEQARADLQSSWNLKPDVSTGLLLNWLRLVMQNGRASDEIAAELEKIAMLDPRHAEACVCQGIALYLREAYSEALTKLALAETAGPENENVYFWQGMALAALGRRVEADLAFSRARDLGLPGALWQPMLRFSGRFSLMTRALHQCDR
jgi:tetratricopeptide (TPR) repeat protein